MPARLRDQGYGRAVSSASTAVVRPGDHGSRAVTKGAAPPVHRKHPGEPGGRLHTGARHPSPQSYEGQQSLGVPAHFHGLGPEFQSELAEQPQPRGRGCQFDRLAQQFLVTATLLPRKPVIFSFRPPGERCK
jgi:hypothetical protein